MCWNMGAKTLCLITGFGMQAAGTAAMGCGKQTDNRKLEPAPTGLPRPVQSFQYTIFPLFIFLAAGFQILKYFTYMDMYLNMYLNKS